MQTWPYCAHVVEPGAGGGVVVPPLLELLLVPPGDVTPLAPHVPFVVPGAMLHGEPAQQSAVVVHAPPGLMHAAPEHTKPVPAAFGTHGLPQQSAPEAHAVPAGGGPFTLQS